MNARHLTHLRADANGQSYFFDEPLGEGVAHPLFPVNVTDLFDGRQVVRWQSGPLTLDWVNAPQRQCFIYLSGQVAMTAGSGETRHFGPGDMLMVEDVTGQGHCTDIPSGLDAIVIQCA